MAEEQVTPKVFSFIIMILIASESAVCWNCENVQPWVKSNHVLEEIYQLFEVMSVFNNANSLQPCLKGI